MITKSHAIGASSALMLMLGLASLTGCKKQQLPTSSLKDGDAPTQTAAASGSCSDPDVLATAIAARDALSKDHAALVTSGFTIVESDVGNWVTAAAEGDRSKLSQGDSHCAVQLVFLDEKDARAFGKKYIETRGGQNANTAGANVQIVGRLTQGAWP